MTTVFVHHRVADYNTWRPEYDRVMAADWSKDIRAQRVWRGLDDPNLVIVASTSIRGMPPRLSSITPPCVRPWGEVA